jgi:hypothetical protein
VTARSWLALAAVAVLQVACSPQASPPASESAAPRSSEATSSSGSEVPSPSTAPAGWVRLTTDASPAAREDHTWTITPDGATAYLFGGRDGSAVLDDLWAYDLATDAWSQISDAGEGPQPRFGHNAAWAPGVGLVIFAGQAGSDFFNDLWAYDPSSNAWRQLPATGAIPVSRYGSCAAIGPDARLWISHGFTSEGQRFADTRAFDFETGAWTDETPVGEAPIRRCLHACWWTGDDELVLYGGQTTGTAALGDLWRLAVGERPGTNQWGQLTPDPLPPDRNLYASARWAAGTLVFGGQGLDGDYLADSWWISDDGTVSELDLSAGAPSPRSGAELIADSARGRLLLFGGRDSSSTFADLWQLVVPSVPQA